MEQDKGVNRNRGVNGSDRITEEGRSSEVDVGCTLPGVTAGRLCGFGIWSAV